QSAQRAEHPVTHARFPLGRPSPIRAHSQGPGCRRGPSPETSTPVRLSISDPGFASALDACLSTTREASEDVDQTVRGIIADVRARGDAALIALSQTFDQADLGAIGIRVSEAEVEAAVRACSPETLEALSFARDRIADHH